MLSKSEEQPGVSPSIEVARAGPSPNSLSVAKNRGRLDTVAEIVNACAGGANKSRVMLVANVNSVVATELLQKLVTSGLVSCSKEENAVAYATTEAGMDFVNKYTELVSMLLPGTVPRTRIAELSRVSWT